MKEIIEANLGQLADALNGIKPEQAEALLQALERHPVIFVVGRGRSGLAMSMFAMRLMQLGLNVHVIGEPTAPAIQAGDLLVIGSGTGETEACLAAAKKAHSLLATIALMTATPDSAIGRLSTLQVEFPCYSKLEAPKASGQMLAGSLFEQSLLVFCDCICTRLALRLHKSQASIMKLHANIE